MNAFKELIKETHARLGTNPEDEFWDGSIDYIYDLIQKVEFDIARNNLMMTFNRLVSYAKKSPPDRALSYDNLRESVLSWASTIPELDDKLREEIGIPEHVFEYPTEEMTEEDINKLAEDKEARKADWLKRNKRKPKTEEEDAQDMEQLRQQINDQLKQKMVDEDDIMGDIEEKINIKNLGNLLNNHVIMDKAKWDEMYRKKSILDIGCEGKNVLLRLDLDVPLSEYIPPPEEEEDQSKFEDTKQAAKIATDSQVNTSSRIGTVKSTIEPTSKLLAF